MRVNIINKLEKTKKTSQAQADLVVEEVKLLMDSESEAERNALRVAGLTNHMEHVDTHKGQEVERAKFEEQYGNSVFTESELKAICMKYDLRMLPSRRFLGKIDGEVATKLKHFMENREGEMGNYSDNFYVIAPSSAFQLEDQPRKPPRQIDPILVYKVPRNDQYVFIHKWGKDFTLWRRFRGFYFQSVFNMLFVNSVILCLIGAVITSRSHGSINTLPETGWLIIPIILGAFLSGLVLYFLFRDEDNWVRRTTERIWDKPTKRRY